MSAASPDSPLEDPDMLVAALREQGLSADEAEETSAALLYLRRWTAPAPDRQHAEQLTARLQASMARVRVRAPHGPAQPCALQQLLALVCIARQQVRILRPSFWLSSAAVVALGGVLVLLRPDAQRTLLLYLLGPLLGYVAVSMAFQGSGLGLLECELACPPRPRQLVVARLTVVLGYTLGLGVCLTLAAGLDGAAQLTLSWLAPLLAEVGATLILSVRMAAERAAAVVYGLWATAVGLSWAIGVAPSGPPAALNVLLALAGLGTIALAVYAAPRLLERELGFQEAAG